MENTSTPPSDRDKRMMSSFERYKLDKKEDEDEDQKKKKRDKSKDKKKDEPQPNEKPKQSDEHPEKPKPSILDMLVDGDDTDKKSKEDKSALSEVADERKEKQEDGEEVLTEEEKLQATEAYILAREQQLQSQEAENKTEEEDPSAFQRLANIHFLNKLQERIKGSNDAPTEADFETLVELTIDDVRDEVQEEHVQELDDELLDEVVSTDSREEALEDHDDVYATVSAPSPSPLSLPRISPAQNTGASVGSGSQSRSGGVTSFVGAAAGSSGGGANSGGGQPPISGASSNTVGGEANPNAFSTIGPPSLPTPERSPVRQHNRAGDLLLGGFVGYLVGRRRGRINTEQERAGVERSLQKQVKNLEQTVRLYEDKTRQRAGESPTLNLTYENPKQTETTVKTPTGGTDIAEAPPQRHNPVESGPTVKTAVKELEPAQERRTFAIQSVPETVPGHIEAPNSAGTEVPTTETVPTPSYIEATKTVDTKVPLAEMRPPKAESMRRAQDNAETAPKQDILHVAETIRYQGKTLRSLHEQADVSERAMRQIVGEHLKGGRIDTIIARSMAESARIKEESMEARTPSDSSSVAPTQSGAPQEPAHSPAAERIMAQPQHRPRQTTGVSSKQGVSDRRDAHRSDSTVRQVTIGAAVGLVFVVMAIILFA